MIEPFPVSRSAASPVSTTRSLKVMEPTTCAVFRVTVVGPAPPEPNVALSGATLDQGQVDAEVLPRHDLVDQQARPLVAALVDAGRAGLTLVVAEQQFELGSQGRADERDVGQAPGQRNRPP